jgi:hypothetical protein
MKEEIQAVFYFDETEAFFEGVEFDGADHRLSCFSERHLTLISLRGAWITRWTEFMEN